MPRHPLLQVVYVLLGGIVLIGALFMGAVLLAVALGFGLIFGLVALLRGWWLGRGRPLSARNSPERDRSKPGNPVAGELLEAEYSVVAERDEPDGRGH